MTDQDDDIPPNDEGASIDLKREAASVAKGVFWDLLKEIRLIAALVGLPGLVGVGIGAGLGSTTLATAGGFIGIALGCIAYAVYWSLR